MSLVKEHDRKKNREGGREGKIEGGNLNTSEATACNFVYSLSIRYRDAS